MNYAEMLTTGICDYTTHAAHWYIGVVEQQNILMMKHLGQLLKQPFKGENGLETTCNDPDMIGGHENWCKRKSDVDWRQFMPVMNGMNKNDYVAESAQNWPKWFGNDCNWLVW